MRKNKMDGSLWLCLLICILLRCSFSFSWNSLTYLNLGSNFLEGPLPSSLCNSQNLEYLILPDNTLSGKIPHCFGNISRQLKVLDLRRNNLQGMIPTTFPEANQLRSLGLYGNQLEGPLPPSLINCKKLEVLDVGHNKISDTFPIWMETLPELRVVILKWNRFRGTIETPMNKSSFQNLRILDLSYNYFTGFLPAEMIKNFHAMKRNDSKTQLQYMGDGRYYSDSVTLIMKEREIQIDRVLTIFTTIDLSGNHFEGKIPESIGDLDSLILLNFSHNKFNGLIPETLGDLSALESLDLSWNQLEGRIPEELVELNFLQVLNLSQNHLSGRIPQGGQFNTFSIYAFNGNSELCGFPLKHCGEVWGSKSSARWIYDHTDFLDLTIGFTWKSVLLGYCFGMILGLCIGVVMFSTRRPKWLVAMVEDKCKTLQKRPRKTRPKMAKEMN